MPTNNNPNDAPWCDPFSHSLCRDEYSIEAHGNGHVIYLGRCAHLHGLNIAFVTEPDLPRLAAMIALANSALHKAQSL